MTQPTLMASVARIFDLSLGQMLWSRRSIFLGFLVGGPIVLAVGIRLVAESGHLPVVNGARVTGPTLFGLLIWLLFVRFIVPVLGIFYGTALIADEVDEKTITYLFTRPIPRSAVLLGKYLAYLVCTLLLTLPAVVIIYFLLAPIGGAIGQGFPSLATDLGMLVLGIASYGAVFALVGARVSRPLVTGLVFAFGWEPAILFVPGYLKHATVAYYLQALVPHSMPQGSGITALLEVFQQTPSVWASLAALAAITGTSLWFAGRTVEEREYVLEQ